MNFLDAFQSAYEAPSPGGSAPRTTREILDRAGQWYEGAAEAEPLVAGMRAMAEKAGANQAATLADLEKAPDMDPGLREPMERSYEAFGVMVEALRALEGAILAGDRDPVPSLLETLEAAGRELTAMGEAMRAWVETPVLRCPRCGQAGSDGWCAPCGLDRLIPDPDFARDRGMRTANLPQPYVDVYRAYTAVVNGEAPLHPLLERLDALEASLRVNRHQAEVYGRHVGSDRAQELFELLSDVLDGVNHMRAVVHTRAMRELHHGWEQVFTAGSGVQGATARVLEEAGRESGHLETADRTTDSVVFEGD